MANSSEFLVQFKVIIFYKKTYSLVLGECFHLLEEETEASRDVLTGPTLTRLVREPGLEPRASSHPPTATLSGRHVDPARYQQGSPSPTPT